MRIERIGVLVGGGPAPGTNGVIAAIAIEGINRGCSVVGLHDGFEWLAQHFTDEQHELTIPEVSRIHLRGGTILGTSRVDAARDAQSLENTILALQKLRVEGLVAIGGGELLERIPPLFEHFFKRSKHLDVIKGNAFIHFPLFDCGIDQANHAQTIFIAGTHGCFHVFGESGFEGHGVLFGRVGRYAGKQMVVFGGI